MTNKFSYFYHYSILVSLTLIYSPKLCNSIIEKSHVNEIKHNPGLFFENLGQTRLTTNTWTLLTHRNLTVYDTILQELFVRNKEIEDLCKLIKQSQNFTNCTPTQQFAYLKLRNINLRFQTLKTMIG